jgi:AraC-like DNA-binding protein
VLATSDLDELRQAVNNNYHPVHCDVGKYSNFSIYYNHAFLNGLSLSYHTITDNVYMHSGPTEDSYILQFGMIQGKSEISYGKSSVVLTPDQGGSLISTSFNCRWRYEKDQQQLITRIEKRRLEQVLESIIGRPIKQAIEFDHKMRRDNPAIESLRRQLFYILHGLSDEEGLFSVPQISAQAVDAFLISLLYAQPHNYSALLVSSVSAAEPTYISQVEEYVREHAAESLTVSDLARRFDISLRALQAGFKKHRRYSLSYFIKQVRLQLAHQLIQQDPYRTIEQIALACGFRHWGQFSADYQKKYAERPIDTRRNALGIS